MDMFGAAITARTDLELTVRRAIAMAQEAMIATRAARRPVHSDAPQADILERAASHLEDARIQLQEALK